jgi:hypothetical protein
VYIKAKAVSNDIEKTNGWNSDARLVLLAVLCARHLDGSNLAKQPELGRRLVELEFGNMKFKQSPAWVEKQLAKSRTAVQPRQKKDPVQKQQAQ